MESGMPTRIRCPLIGVGYTPSLPSPAAGVHAPPARAHDLTAGARPPTIRALPPCGALPAPARSPITSGKP